MRTHFPGSYTRRTGKQTGGQNTETFKGARGFLKPLKYTACGCNTNRKRPSVILRILKYP